MKKLTNDKKKEYKKPTNENPKSRYRILVNDPGLDFKIINKIRITVYPKKPIKPLGIPYIVAYLLEFTTWHPVDPCKHTIGVDVIFI